MDHINTSIFKMTNRVIIFKSLYLKIEVVIEISFVLGNLGPNLINMSLVTKLPITAGSNSKLKIHKDSNQQ